MVEGLFIKFVTYIYFIIIVHAACKTVINMNANLFAIFFMFSIPFA